MEFSTNIEDHDNDVMCILPWIHMHPWPNGKTMLCCDSPWEDHIGDLRENSLEEVWNSEKMKQVRLNMLNGKKCSQCVRCYEKEEKGHDSLRVRSNKDWLQPHWNKVANTNSDGSLDDLHIVYLDFRFSNVCNLRCRYCGPELSSNWYADAKASTFNISPTERVIQIRKDVDNFMEEFDPMLEHIEQIYWAGGEPIMMDEHWGIMNRLVEMGKTDIRIFYNTNFTTLTYKKHNVLDLWKNFDNISVGASLDAEGVRGEYQRKGTVWADVESNIKQLIETSPEVDFYISATVSAYNAWHITDFHRSWVDKGYIKPADWYMNVLLNNQRFRMSVLPETLRKEIKYKWEKHLAWLEPQDHIGRATDGYKSAIKFLDDDHTHLLDEFKAFNVEFDKLRDENFDDVYPELKGI
ncbi:twitch domain-containing radical SAM protein [bacterium]|nr:twitch domain-containing radical SAM protein [bacterium]